jgi:hypothetical protein
MERKEKGHAEICMENRDEWISWGYNLRGLEVELGKKRERQRQR